MRTLIPVLLLSVALAFLSEKSAIDANGNKNYNTRSAKIFFGLLVCVLALPVGLRTSYNDTWVYIQAFQGSPPLAELFVSGKLHILVNPAYNILICLLNELTGNYHVFFLLTAFFIQYAFLKTIQRYSSSFTLGVLFYICLGTYVFTFAALKQTIAMAFLMLSLPKLLNRQYGIFYLLVFVGFLFHTYALAFAVLPLLVAKPWKVRTFVLIAVVVFVFTNFESVIGSFLDYANEQGKSVAEYEVFDNAQVNYFRVAVYGVVPMLSLLFVRYLRHGNNPQYDLLIHMSLISLAFMILGTVSGANMFGRMATYFEIGMICSLTWIIDRSFEPKSVKLVSATAVICFFCYFVYAWHFNLDFDAAYSSITIIQFARSLFV